MRRGSITQQSTAMHYNEHERGHMELNAIRSIASTMTRVCTCVDYHSGVMTTPDHTCDNMTHLITL